MQIIIIKVMFVNTNALPSKYLTIIIFAIFAMFLVLKENAMYLQILLAVLPAHLLSNTLLQGFIQPYVETHPVILLVNHALDRYTITVHLALMDIIWIC